MADLSKIILPNNAEYNIKDEVAREYIDGQSVIIGTQTAATRFMTGVAGFSELKNGTSIIYWKPYGYKAEAAGTRTSGVLYRYSITVTYPSGTSIASIPGDGSSSYNVWLNLTLADGSETGWIPVYYASNTRMTTHYNAGIPLRLTYLEEAPIGSVRYTGWWATPQYYDNTYNRIRLQNVIKAKSAIAASTFIVGDESGYFKLAGGVPFELRRGLLWAGSTIFATKTGDNNFICLNGCTLRNNTSSSFALTQYKSCYLVGTLSGDIFTPSATNFITDTEPTSEDGLVYMYMGPLYSTYQIYFSPFHPLYKYSNGEFKSLEEIGSDALEIAETNMQSIRNVGTQIDQSAQDVLDTVSGIYATSDALTQAQTNLLATINENSANVDGAISQIYAAIQAGDNANAELINTLTEYIVAAGGEITFTTDGGPITLTLQNDGLLIKNGDTAVCSFSASGVLLPATTVIPLNGTLQMGNFQWTPRSSGNLSLLYIGG